MSTCVILPEYETAGFDSKTMVAFSMQQSVYQSALKSGAAVIQPSLLDFLR